MAGRGQPKTGGRKKGTANRATADVRELAQQHSREALETLVWLMRHAESETVQIAACREILDRAVGRPRQEIELATPEPPREIRMIQIVGVPAINSRPAVVNEDGQLVELKR